MKILLITTVYKSEVVGPARFARLLESRADINVGILTSSVSETGSLKNVPLKFKWWQSKLKIFFGIKQFQKRLKELESEYDFLIFNSAILAYKLETKKPYLVMVNDEKLIGLKPFFKFDFIRRLIHKKAEKSAVRHADKIIVNSSYIGKKLIEAYNVNPKSVHTLLKGISLENKRRPYEHKELSYDQIINILFVKNDYKIGGLLDLVEALKSLADMKFVLTIVGPENLDINDFPRLNNVEIKIKGMILNDEVIKTMYEHDILCIPSRFEPLGVAIMEGLAVGIPIVTTGQGGLHEVTKKGMHVWQCEPNNPISIADQISQCIENKSDRIAKSEAGKKYVSKKFDFDNVTHRLLEIIQI